MQQQIKRSESLPDVMRKALDIHHAARVLNDCIHERPVSVQAERVALAIYNKTVPSYQAIMLDVVQSGPSTVHDLNAMCLSAGVKPIDITPETASAEKDE